jgi:hypothetical protein
MDDDTKSNDFITDHKLAEETMNQEENVPHTITEKENIASVVIDEIGEKVMANDETLNSVFTDEEEVGLNPTSNQAENVTDLVSDNGNTFDISFHTEKAIDPTSNDDSILNVVQHDVRSPDIVTDDANTKIIADSDDSESVVTDTDEATEVVVNDDKIVDIPSDEGDRGQKTMDDDTIIADTIADDMNEELIANTVNSMDLAIDDEEAEDLSAYDSQIRTPIVHDNEVAHISDAKAEDIMIKDEKAAEIMSTANNELGSIMSGNEQETNVVSDDEKLPTDNQTTVNVWNDEEKAQGVLIDDNDEGQKIMDDDAIIADTIADDINEELIANTLNSMDLATDDEEAEDLSTYDSQTRTPVVHDNENVIEPSETNFNQTEDTMIEDEKAAEIMSTGINEFRLNVVSDDGNNELPVHIQHTVNGMIDADRIIDIPVEHQNVPDIIINDDSAGFFTASKSVEKLANDEGKAEKPTTYSKQVGKTMVFNMKLPPLTTKVANLEPIVNTQNAGSSMTDAKNPEDTVTDSAQAEETMTKSDDERIESVTVSGTVDTIIIENELLGNMNKNRKKSVTIAASRKANQQSFLRSPSTILSNTSKESHMRALPSDIFWRRNQRRVSNMSTAEEGQLAQK